MHIKITENYAPVLISVYDRFEHFKKCVESLSKNNLSSKTELYITSDGPRGREDAEIISRIRNYIDGITSFRKVHTFLPESNTKGKITAEANKALRAEHNKIIRAEDDIVFSENYLDFMNDALDYYKNNDQIMSVSGFSHSVFLEKNENLGDGVYFSQRFNAWGYGAWLRHRDIVKEYKDSDFLNLIGDKSFQKRLNSVGIDRYPQIQRVLSNNLPLPPDYKTGLVMLERNMFTVYPYRTRTFNIGNDGSGMRSGKNNNYLNFDYTPYMRSHPYYFTQNINENIRNDYHYRFFNSPKNKFKFFLSKTPFYNLAYHLFK